MRVGVPLPLPLPPLVSSGGAVGTDGDFVPGPCVRAWLSKAQCDVLLEFLEDGGMLRAEVRAASLGQRCDQSWAGCVPASLGQRCVRPVLGRVCTISLGQGACQPATSYQLPEMGKVYRLA